MYGETKQTNEVQLDVKTIETSRQAVFDFPPRALASGSPEDTKIANITLIDV